MLRFTESDNECMTIARIVGRAQQLKLVKRGAQTMYARMDISATHASGCPLRLDELLNTDDFNFVHDFCGIRKNLNRITGKLENCFVPRFAKAEGKS